MAQQVTDGCGVNSYFAPNFNLQITPSNMENLNNPKDVEANKIRIFEALRELDHVPSTQIGTEVPEDPGEESEDEDEQNPDEAKVCSLCWMPVRTNGGIGGACG